LEKITSLGFAKPLIVDVTLFKVQSDLSPYFLRTILGMILLAILGIGVILSNISLDNDLAS
jgi:hypothetical protein